jgi:hypothetical protein
MKRHLTGATCAAALLALASPAAAEHDAQLYPMVAGPVTITSCSLNEKSADSTVARRSLRINYFNNGPQRLSSVTFGIVYNAMPAVTVTDTGAIDFQKPITHQFDELGGKPWSGPIARCGVVSATFADGQVVTPPFPFG